MLSPHSICRIHTCRFINLHRNIIKTWAPIPACRLLIVSQSSQDAPLPSLVSIY